MFHRTLIALRSTILLKPIAYFTIFSLLIMPVARSAKHITLRASIGVSIGIIDKLLGVVIRLHRLRTVSRGSISYQRSNVILLAYLNACTIMIAFIIESSKAITAQYFFSPQCH